MAPDSFSTKTLQSLRRGYLSRWEPTGEEPLTLHHDAQERLEEVLAQAAHEPSSNVRQGQGRVILLRAPRAGYGKSHLLHHLRASHGTQAMIVPVEFDAEEKITWKPLFDQVLTALHEPLADGTTALDHVARRTFAALNAAMLRTGKVPMRTTRRSRRRRGGPLHGIVRFRQNRPTRRRLVPGTF